MFVFLVQCHRDVPHLYDLVMWANRIRSSRSCQAFCVELYMEQFQQWRPVCVLAEQTVCVLLDLECLLYHMHAGDRMPIGCCMPWMKSKHIFMGSDRPFSMQHTAIGSDCMQMKKKIAESCWFMTESYHFVYMAVLDKGVLYSYSRSGLLCLSFSWCKQGCSTWVWAKLP